MQSCALWSHWSIFLSAWSLVGSCWSRDTELLEGPGWSVLAVIITAPVTTRYQKLKETGAAVLCGDLI